MEILQNVNIAGVVINIGMLIIAIIVMTRTGRKSQIEKFEQKADKIEVLDIKAELKIKANSIDIEDKLKVVHHRIDDTNKSLDKYFNLLIDSQTLIQKDIKDLLKRD